MLFVCKAVCTNTLHLRTCLDSNANGEVLGEKDMEATLANMAKALVKKLPFNDVGQKVFLNSVIEGNIHLIFWLCPQ